MPKRKRKEEDGSKEGVKKKEKEGGRIEGRSQVQRSDEEGGEVPSSDQD